MKLYIAEKPSLGKAIADALPAPHHRGDGCIYVGHQDKQRCDVVSWCIGHLLEQAEPDAYDDAYKKWSHDTLPIVPDQLPQGWKLSPKKQTRKQFSVLKKLLKQADHIVHCGDPDREGQLLVDEFIHHVGVSAARKSSIERCLVSDLNLPAVRRSLSALRPNKEFAALSASALARSRADWLFGMNLTRAYTIQAQKVGYAGVVSVGRVQTPLLGLVVRRDHEIEAFVPKDYYEVDAQLETEKQERFTARWQPSEACAPYQDAEGRVISQALAQNVINRIKSQPAVVTHVEAKRKQQSAPLAYNLSALQIDAAKVYGLSAKMVLDVCQALYERHKLITYPRSDNRYLPGEHFKQASQVCRAIAANSSLKTVCDQADLTIRGRVWNDSKVGAHHAIIPTDNTRKQGLLSRVEQQVYDLIAKQYLCQFYPAWEYVDQKVSIEIAGGLFLAKHRETLCLGWKQVIKPASDQSEQAASLPELTKGQALSCLEGSLLCKKTQPAKYFTDASLLAAMTGIARYVSDPNIKKILKDTDGLGTEATRASIIELLFRRNFICREGKNIKATEAGKRVIEALPDCVSLPDMTAHWEMMLNQISLNECRYEDFMQPLVSQIGGLLGEARSCLPKSLAGVTAPKKTAKRRYKSRGKKTTSAKKTSTKTSRSR